MTKPRLHTLAPLLILALFGAALWELHHALAAYHYHDIVRQLRAIPAPRLAAALGLTALSYLALTAYDGLAIVYVGRSLGRGRVALASFISYAFSNTIGLSLLTSGSIRYRLYSAWGLSAEEIARVVAFTVATFWLGLLTVGGAVFLAEPLALPASVHLPFASLRPLGLLFLAVVGGYLLLVGLRRRPFTLRGWEFRLPALHLAWSQLLVGALDWALAGSVLYVLLPADAALSYPHWLGIFLLAQVVALISHVPGGLGVFESLVLLLAPGVPLDALAGALLVYRGIYYLLPLGLAALLLGGREVRRKQGRLAQATLLAGRWTSVMVPQLLAASALVGGAVLLFSGATPAIPERLHWLHAVLPLPVVEISHFLGSLAGAGLLLLARGLQRRLDAAYLLAAALLAAGSLLSLLKGVDYEEALLLLAVLAALLPCRRYFYRRTSLLGETFTASWVATILLVLLCSLWLGLFAYKHQAYSGELWWRFALRGDAPRFLRAEVGASVLLLLFAAAKLLRPNPPAPMLPDPGQLQLARQVVARAPQTSANLALLGDKTPPLQCGRQRLHHVRDRGPQLGGDGRPGGRTGGAGRAGLAVPRAVRTGGGLAGLLRGRPGDPPPLPRPRASLRSRSARRRGCRWPSFPSTGKARSGLRHPTGAWRRTAAASRWRRPRPCPPCSPSWRRFPTAGSAAKNTREKGFSLGYFDADYLCNFPCALVRREGRIVAFANLWPGADRGELSIDLMRFHPDAPNGDHGLPLRLPACSGARSKATAGSTSGWRRWPGSRTVPLRPLWHRIGALIFRHGEHFYNFQGLREYKEKFAPQWSPRYIAAPGGLALPRVLTNIATLVSGGLKGVIGK